MFSYLFNQVTVKVLGHEATSKVAQISYRRGRLHANKLQGGN